MKLRKMKLRKMKLRKMASQVSLMKFSPDGEFFATAGQDDCLVKVWYNTSKWKLGVSRLFTPPEPSECFQGELAFSFVYLAHPRSVTGFSWRKTSKYMPRGAVCNVLLTCCKDSVCRLWAETLLPGDGLLSGYNNNHASSQHGDTPGCAGPPGTACNGKSRGRTAQELRLVYIRNGAAAHFEGTGSAADGLNALVLKHNT
ncbi:DmX-like protein 1 [Liparis tanakae]|uniref:DmX-like protein 1 n=1 Tax=Liparis tanakae TaxID=230148 RepID=A0A4Z2H2P6_9TELE|nr:DmX-like protein 1 [Liparis tanakae]